MHTISTLTRTNKGQAVMAVVWATASLVGLAIAGTSCAADAPKAADAKPKENLGQRQAGEVGRNDELGFLQAKVSAQMTELEERMFRLSDALKSMEPENASRLLIGLKYAREELIQLQMKEVQTNLSEKKYADAMVEQKELLAKLRRLEQLLLSPDLDFQLQLERLRLMRDLMRRLDSAIQEEEREKSASDQSAGSEDRLKEVRQKLAALKALIERQTAHNQQGTGLFPAPVETPDDESPADALKALPATDEPKDADPADLESLAKAQAETQEQTKELGEKPGSLAAAARNMQSAVKELTSDKPQQALPEQAQALEQLKKAQQSLQDEERELETLISEKRFAELKKDQSNNRKATDGINEMAVQLGDAGVGMRGDLSKASNSMMSAEGSLGGGEADSASGSQEDAIDELKAARAKLAAEAEKLLGRLRGEIKKRTIEGIVQMLEGQVAVRESTDRLAPRVKTGARTALNSVVALAGSENKLVVIGEGLTALVEETEFGIALPAALRSVTEGMVDVKERLGKADASEEVVAAEKQIEEDLQSLLDAMKQLPSNGSGNGGNGGNRSDRERQLNQIIAELKMVKLLQVRLNRDTKDVNGHRPGDAEELTAELTRKIESLEGRQEDVFDVVERIALERGDDLPEIPE